MEKQIETFTYLIDAAYAVTSITYFLRIYHTQRDPMIFYSL